MSVPTTVACSQEAFHVKRTHDETEWSRSGDGNSCFSPRANGRTSCDLPLETSLSFGQGGPYGPSLRLCSTARLDLAPGWKSQRSSNQSTTAPMSSTACMLARGTSQKIGRKPPGSGLSCWTYLPNFHCVPLKVTSSGYLTPTTVWYVSWETLALLESTNPHFWRPDTPAASAKDVASMLGRPSLLPRRPIHKMAKAARCISVDRHGGESPMSSC